MTTQRPAAIQRGDSLYHAVLLVVCGGVLLLALVLSVRGSTQVVLPLLGLPLPELCFLRRIAGLSCPGCGLTRCFISLAHGDLGAAWSYNPAGLLLFAMIAFQVPYRTLQLWRIRRGIAEFQPGRIAHLVIGAFAVALVGQWVLRVLGAAL
jgi:hypothetical protein